MNISAKLEQRPTILHVLMVNPLGYKAGPVKQLNISKVLERA